MKLYYTPRSHFSRKVRILLDAWSVPALLLDVGNVAERSSEVFGSNPLMRVPTWVDGATWIIDSDHIARYLTPRYDPEDAFGVLTDDVSLLNLRAVMNGVMASEVELILARRTGIDTDAYPRFDKIRSAITQGLDWLEANAVLFPERPSYAGFHLTCLWDHLVLYDLVALDHPRLRAIAARMSCLPFVAMSAPT
ncbi:MAG: glutathione S-transferase family protein [Deltaproteobacteria bacterium]|nr:glutathione S-transferase family protein [Deltaproteobacteria bacterium]